MAKGKKTGVFDSWEACQKVTKVFHGAVFKSFTGKKEAEVWLKEHKDTAEKEKGPKNLGSKENNVDIKDGENVKHCTDDCKYDGRDEKYGDTIKCCYAKSGITRTLWG